jgi:hypothetical protein
MSRPSRASIVVSRSLHVVRCLISFPPTAAATASSRKIPPLSGWMAPPLSFSNRPLRGRRSGNPCGSLLTHPALPVQTAQSRILPYCEPLWQAAAAYQGESTSLAGDVGMPRGVVGGAGLPRGRR